MNSPQEKAIELVDKFMLHNSYQSIVWYNAKQCALIAVDEILKVLCTPHKNESEYMYWNEVKQEIDKI